LPTTAASTFCAAKEFETKPQAAAAVRRQVLPRSLLCLALGTAVETSGVSLPPKERACVLLKDVFDYSLEEIAELVDTTVEESRRLSAAVG